jgi:hypothetical protein
MIFADLPAGVSIFLDANTLVYYFGPRSVVQHVSYNRACDPCVKCERV